MKAPWRIRWHTVAFLMAFLMLAGLAWQGKKTQQSLLKANQSVSNKLELITAAQEIFSTLQDIELGERGFVITGIASYMEPYEIGLMRLNQQRQRMNQLFTKENPPNSNWLHELDLNIQRKLEISAGSIIARRETGLTATAERVVEAGGKQTMDHLRALFKELEDFERKMLSTEMRAVDDELQRGRQFVWIGSSMVVFLLLGAFWALGRSLRLRERLAYKAEAIAARLNALLHAIPDTLYEVDHARRIRCLSVASNGDLAVPRAIESVLLTQLPEQADEGPRQFEWRDERGYTFEIHIAPTGTGHHLAIARDISENKRHRETLQDQWNFLRSIVDADESLIFVRDAVGRFMFCNLAFASLLNMRPEDIEGRRPEDIALADLLQPLLEGDSPLLAQDDSELRLPMLDFRDAVQRERCLQLHKRPLTLSNGARLVLAVGVDISARRQVERMKSQFISTVSHELRTPLTAIKSALAMLISGMAGDIPSGIKPLLDIAAKNSERLVNLINDILDIEKAEAGRLEFHMSAQMVLPLLKQALRDNSPYAQEYGITLVLQEPLKDANIHVDPDRFEQAMANLLSNAIKHSTAGDVVSVDLIPHEQNIEIGITDHGPGIPESFKARIFERFAQADSSDIRRRGGTGLGLAITRTIVEQMGGQIGFESELGQGARFFVKLSRAEQPPVSPSAFAQPLTRRILILESSPAAAAQLADILQQQGYLTATAQTITQARDLLSQNAFHALTLSPALPDEDCVAFLQDLREQLPFRHLPVLVISLQACEHTIDNTKVRGSAVGVMDWLHKSFDPARVLNIVNACVLRPGQRCSILHIEDDADLRAVLANLLEPLQLDLFSAANLREARQELAKRHHDLAILDLMLPDGDGSELIEELALASPPTPVIIFSAVDTPAANNDLVLRRLVKSRHNGPDLAALIKQLLQQWIPTALPDSHKEAL